MPAQACAALVLFWTLRRVLHAALQMLCACISHVHEDQDYITLHVTSAEHLCLQVCSPDCVTPQLSESAAESAIREALVRLASSEKVIRLASPVDLDAPHTTNPHAITAESLNHGLPAFTLAALDSPNADCTALARQPSESVNGPEAGHISNDSPITGPSASSPRAETSPEGNATSAPFQEVVQQLLSSPKLAITGTEADASDKTPYQTLLQHLMGGSRVAPSSPEALPSAPAASRQTYKAPVLCPAIQATPARHRCADASTLCKCCSRQSASAHAACSAACCTK